MRKLVLILLAFIAVMTFIRAYDNAAVNYSVISPNGIQTDGVNSNGIHSEAIQLAVE